MSDPHAMICSNQTGAEMSLLFSAHGTQREHAASNPRKAVMGVRGFIRRGRVPTGVMSLVVLLAGLMTACGSSTHVSTGSGASCASLSPSKYLKSAQVAFLGTMLAGPSVKPGGQSVLVSPARVRVTHYLKGSGPRIVSVATAVSHGNVVNAEGIEPRVGEHWQIYTSSRSIPYQTSTCDGSVRTNASS